MKLKLLCLAWALIGFNAVGFSSVSAQSVIPSSVEGSFHADLQQAVISVLQGTSRTHLFKPWRKSRSL